MLVNLRHATAIRAAVFAMPGRRLALRLSIQKHVAKDCGLGAGDRVEVLFGYDNQKGVVVIRRAATDQFGYRFGKRNGSYDIQLNVTRIPHYLNRAMATASCEHAIVDGALQIVLPVGFLNNKAA